MKSEAPYQVVFLDKTWVFLKACIFGHPGTLVSNVTAFLPVILGSLSFSAGAVDCVNTPSKFSTQSIGIVILCAQKCVRSHLDIGDI